MPVSSRQSSRVSPFSERAGLMDNRPRPFTRCNGAYGHHLSRKCLFICVHLHAYFGACARRHARNRTRSSMRRNRTVENEISAVPFLCVAIRRPFLCHYLPSAHVIHVNHVQLRVWGASGQRASPEGSTDKPTVASSRSKRPTTYSYKYVE